MRRQAFDCEKSCSVRAHGITRGNDMKERNFVRTVAMAFGLLSATAAFSQTQVPQSGPAEGGSPAWYIQGSFPDPGGNTIVTPGGKVSVIPRVAEDRSQVMTACSDSIARYCAGQTGFGATGCLKTNADKLTGSCKEAVAAIPAAPGDAVPGCTHSTICGHTGGVRVPRQRVEWKQTLGYTYAYPYNLPQGPGGVPSVALDSKGDLWAFKRSPAGTPQLYEFSPTTRSSAPSATM